MMNFFLCIFLLSGCATIHELDTPKSSTEKKEFSFGSILENTSFFKKDVTIEKEKVIAHKVSNASFEKFCTSVAKTTGATISIANDQKGIILTDWFYNDKRTTRHCLQISVKTDIKNSEFLFIREDFIEGRWVPKAVNPTVVKIIQNDIIRNLAA